MSVINFAAIEGKVKEYAASAEGRKKVKNRLNEYRRNGVSTTKAGSVVTTTVSMMQAAQAFISILKSIAPSMLSASAGSVAAHFNSLYALPPEELPDGSAKVEIWFMDDLSRNSLDNDDGVDGGINNIVALFNNGYAANGYAYGWWDGHSATGDSVLRSGSTGSAWIRSKRERQGLKFMQMAAEQFNRTYGAKYNVVVNLAEVYDDDI